MVIYGDDGTTPNIDEGMNGSEDFTLKLYQASSGLYIDYPSNSGATYFSGWLNTNGSPIPAYSNVTDIYNFLNTSNVTLSLNIQLCENGSSIQLIGGFPTGGVYFGNGVNGSVFDPTIAGDGNHTITYIVNGDSASSMATVYALAKFSFQLTSLLKTIPYRIWQSPLGTLNLGASAVCCGGSAYCWRRCSCST